MSHLLHLNSCDNYPNKCPHICLHLIVKYQVAARTDFLVRASPYRGRALYAPFETAQVFFEEKTTLISPDSDCILTPPERKRDYTRHAPQRKLFQQHIFLFVQHRRNAPAALSCVGNTHT